MTHQHNDETAEALTLKRYQQIVELAGYVIFTTDHEGNFTYVSESAERLTGYRASDLVGQQFTVLVDPTWRERVRAFYVAQRREGLRESTLEFPIVTLSGETRWVEQQVITPQDPESATPFQAIVRDVTARKREEIRYQALFEQSNDGVFILDLDGRHLAANRRAADMFGYTLDEILAFSYKDLVAPEEHAQSETVLEGLQTGVQALIYERLFRCKDGTTFRAEVNVQVVRDDAGRPLHIQSIVRDISDLRQAQAQLHDQVNKLTILHQVEAELDARLDVGYVATMALDAAMRLSGARAGYIALTDEQDVMQLAEIAGDYDRSKIEKHLRLGGGAVGRVIQQRQAELIPDVGADPDYVPIRSSTRSQITIPLMSQEKLIGVLNLQSDRAGVFTEEVFDFVKLITSRISVALDNARLYDQSETQRAQLQELYDRVSRLEQLKTDMIRIASHDLRNPLSTILGYIDLIDWALSELPEKGELPNYLETMGIAARRMQKIILDILSLERIEMAAQNPLHDQFDLRETVRALYEEHVPQAVRLKRKMNLHIADAAMLVQGDAAQLREAISNLISNAIKYTRDEGRIEVRLWQQDRRVIYEVEDNGYGIREEQQARLFQPFYRARTAETVSIEGTGLGLHLVKNIIDRHGGAMRFKSVYGDGSTFGFELPLADSRTAAS